jgi:hypothetical protein
MKAMKTYHIPLYTYNITGLDNVCILMKDEKCVIKDGKQKSDNIPTLPDIIEYLDKSEKKGYLYN